MTYTLLIAIVVGVMGQLDQTEDAGQREITPWRKAFDRQAKEYVITAVDEPANAFQLVEKPVFLWNQPLRQQFTQIGSVYVWLGPDGRPGAIGTLYCWKMPDEHWSLSHEFLSLASTLLFYMGLGGCLFLTGFWSIVWIVEGASTFSEPPHIVVLQMTGMLAEFLLVVYALFWLPAVAIDRRDERRSSDGLKQL